MKIRVHTTRSILISRIEEADIKKSGYLAQEEH
jgi:hypothetical protein